MWQGIDHVLAAPQNKGEWFLTDAFQWMIERGARIRTAEVAGWYDCGTVETTLETNRILLEQQMPGRRAGSADDGRQEAEDGRAAVQPLGHGSSSRCTSTRTW